MTYTFFGPIIEKSAECLYLLSAPTAQRVIQRVDRSVRQTGPYKLIGMTAVGTALFLKLYEYYNSNTHKSPRDIVGRLALQVPLAQDLMNSEINEEFKKNKSKVLKEWEDFGDPITTIPEKGYSDEEIIAILQIYTDETAKKLANKHISGTVYTNSLKSKCPDIKNLITFNESTEGMDELTLLAFRILKLTTLAFFVTSLWNELHADEFGVCNFINYQVVRMVADMFGGKRHEVKGFITSGGTESLMLAMRAYRNYALKERGIEANESVILAPRSIHAAINKAATDYHLNVVYIDVDENGDIDMEDYANKLEQYKESAIAVVGSAPAYPKGNVDPIKEMAKIAYDYHIPMHVDCCLGGFVINNLDQYDTNYLQMEGVSSCSADNHKYGYTEWKGSSTVVFRNWMNTNIALYSIYTEPSWEGGLYGTPTTPGSKSCLAALAAFIAMLVVGKDGYKNIAQQLHQKAKEFGNCIKEELKDLTLIREPDVHVVAFKINPSLGYEYGASYGFACEMSKRGFILNGIKGDAVHFAVTPRFLGDKKGIADFKKAALESLEQVKKDDLEIKEEKNDPAIIKKKRFPGAATYCCVREAIEPTVEDLGWIKFVRNYLCGKQGTDAGVVAHFSAILDPYDPI